MPTAKEYQLNFINTCLAGDTSTTLKVIKEIKQLTLSQKQKTELLELLKEILAFQLKIKNQPKDTKNLVKLLFFCSYVDSPQTLQLFNKWQINDFATESAKYIGQLLFFAFLDQLWNKEYVFKFELPEPLNLTSIESDELAKLLDEE